MARLIKQPTAELWVAASKPRCAACHSYTKPLQVVCAECDIRVCSDLCKMGYEHLCEACNITKICSSDKYCGKCEKMLDTTIWIVHTYNSHGEICSERRFPDEESARKYYFSSLPSEFTTHYPKEIVLTSDTIYRMMQSNPCSLW